MYQKFEFGSRTTLIQIYAFPIGLITLNLAYLSPSSWRSTEFYGTILQIASAKTEIICSFSPNTDPIHLNNHRKLGCFKDRCVFTDTLYTFFFPVTCKAVQFISSASNQN